jgi:type II secretory pathway predicted ATPase ExeA
MIETLQSHYGFTVMPFTAAIPVTGLFSSAAHKEAVARLRWLISAIGNQRYQNLLNVRRDTCAA